MRTVSKGPRNQSSERSEQTPKYNRQPSVEAQFNHEGADDSMIKGSTDQNNFDFYRETFNQENLEYINSLLANKNGEQSSGHHKKSKSSLYTSSSNNYNNTGSSLVAPSFVKPQQETLKIEKQSSKEFENISEQKTFTLSASQMSEKGTGGDIELIKKRSSNLFDKENEKNLVREMERSSENKKLFDDFFRSQSSEAYANKKIGETRSGSPVLKEISTNSKSIYE